MRNKQPEKALVPMLVTLLPMSTKVNDEQAEKALVPMLVTLLPMSTEVSDEKL